MKRCPECRRDYYDDSLLYCLDDGTALLEGPASGGWQTYLRELLAQTTDNFNSPSRRASILAELGKKKKR
jgi:hypothetical protein